MPGRQLHRLARLLCAADADRVIEPLLADLQREWIEGVNRGRVRRGVSLARAYGAFWQTLVRCCPAAIVRGALSPIAPKMVIPATLAFVCALVAVTLLRFVGASRVYWQQPATAFILGELHAWSWAVVFAMVPAFMYARRQPDRHWNATTSRLLVIGLLISIAFVGWIGPALFSAHEHARGLLLDERLQPAFQSLPTVIRAARNQETGDAVVLQLEVHRRLATIVSALLLGMIGWQLSAIRRPSIGRALVWWFALTELVLASGAYAGRDLALQWRAPILLGIILLILNRFGRRHDLKRFASIPYCRTL